MTTPARVLPAELRNALANQLLYATSIRPLMSKLLGETDFEKKAVQDDYFCRAWDLFLTDAGRQV